MPLGPTASRLLPYLNFTIATAALAFQTTVLYPWHHELDAEFKRLKEDQRRMLKELHDAKLERIAQVESKITLLDHKLRALTLKP
ncbi:hypothetical protein C2E23DRAFT_865807 [Lenzites betulinus]|nr:hypothetical protein C2E23DRAFT_865807 [Lenzites betulinus]